MEIGEFGFYAPSGISPRGNQLRRVLPSYGNRNSSAVLYVSMNMCVYGNEMCLYCTTRAGWVLSTLTQAPFQTFHSSERGESV